MLAKALLLAAVCGLTEASPIFNRAGYKVKEVITIPRGWQKVSEANGNQEMTFSIGLKQSNFEELERQLYEVSDPAHAKYGKHLSVEDISELVKPTDKTLQAVHDWLASNGISFGSLDYSPAKDWINFKMSVADAEALLDTKFDRYRHEDGTELTRTLDYSIPHWLHSHIDTIQPTNSFLRTRPQTSGAMIVKDSTAATKVAAAAPNAAGGVAAVCTPTNITPNCLRTLYGTIDYKVKAPAGNKIAIQNYLGQIDSRTDAQQFLSEYRTDINAAAAANGYRQVSINNGPTTGTPGVEADLDIETVLGISYPTNVTVYSTGGSPPFNPDINTPTDTNEPYANWTQYILALPQTQLPTIATTSYGDDEQTVPRDYATRVCAQFAAIGARGVSLFFSSGDGGVGPNGTCFSNDGKNTPEFLPAFPASCPYVTSVGATKLVEATQPEQAAYDPSNGFVTGAGFSNYFPRPLYQNPVIPLYLASIGNKNAGLYNPNGRAYPDISANGQRYAIVYEGRNVHVDGTSCSCPATASIFALINDARISKGLPPLGFLNPFLYTIGQAGFNDITQGNSMGCDTQGFPAQAGWDAATGFGTPNFQKLLLLTGSGFGF